MGVPGKASLERRHLRRRAARRLKRDIFEVWSQTSLTWAEAAAYVADPGNQTMCELCGWTFNMVCPECERGCACDSGNCSGWRHSEYGDDEDDYDATDCEGCGAGNEYECVCYQRTADGVDDGPERDWHQEWKDDQMQRPQEEPDYWMG